jgi:hypothetical protein
MSSTTTTTRATANAANNVEPPRNSSAAQRRWQPSRRVRQEPMRTKQAQAPPRRRPRPSRPTCPPRIATAMRGYGYAWWVDAATLTEDKHAKEVGVAPDAGIGSVRAVVGGDAREREREREVDGGGARPRPR